MAWTDQDLRWLKVNYPALKPQNDGFLAGKLNFRMLHADSLNYVRPNRAMLAQKRSTGVYIVDSYCIKIEWKKHALLPNTYETDGRIEAVARQKNKPLLDMHINTNGNSLCVAAAMDLLIVFARGCSLQRYIEEFLIPYLFAQTYYAANNEWLWEELSHDFWGHLEQLSHHDDPGLLEIKVTYSLIKDRLGSERTAALFARRCRWHHPCLCGSGKRNVDCHPDIRKAISLIRGAMSSGLL